MALKRSESSEEVTSSALYSQEGQLLPVTLQML